MRRVSRFLLRNWPLKVGAVVLATVLYSGLVLSENVRTYSGTVPVAPIRTSPTATLLTDLPPVNMIRYRAPLDVGVLSPDSFNATVDLSRVEAVPGGDPVTVPVSLVALDRRVEIVDFVPQELQILLEPVDERQMPVRVEVTAPEDVEDGTPQVEPSEVTVRGASSRVASVREVVARVSLDASALNVDRDFELMAVDEQGNQVANVDVEPDQARVRISVARQLDSRTLVVVPQIVGDPAPGYRLEPVTVRPLTVTVSGEASVITRMETVSTDPIDITGRENDLDARGVGLELPAGVTSIGPSEVRITVPIAPQYETRTYSVAVVPVGAHSDLAYLLAATQVNITLYGPVSQLLALDEAQLVATVQVADLDAGQHEVPITYLPPGGLELLAISPAEVVVDVTNRLQLPPVPTTGPFVPPAP